MDEDFEEQKNVPAETSGAANPRPNFATRRADALVLVAEAYLADTSKQCEGGDSYLVHVHTDAETEIEDCGCVPAETARRMSCDAGVVHWLENPGGEPLNVGRKTRTIPPAIRRALTPITYVTGLMAVRLRWITWCCFAAIITG